MSQDWREHRQTMRREAKNKRLCEGRRGVRFQVKFSVNLRMKFTARLKISLRLGLTIDLDLGVRPVERQQAGLWLSVAGDVSLGEWQVRRQAGKEDTLGEETRTASDSRTRTDLFPSDCGRMREAGEALAQASS